MVLDLNVDDGMVDGVSDMVGRFLKIAMTEPDISKSSIHDRLLEIPRHRRLNFLVVVVVIILCYVCGHPTPAHKYEIHKSEVLNRGQGAEGALCLLCCVYVLRFFGMSRLRTVLVSRLRIQYIVMNPMNMLSTAVR